jgi:hypothetical protein
MLLDKQSLAKLIGKPIEEIRIGFTASTFDLKGQTSVLYK